MLNFRFEGFINITKYSIKNIDFHKTTSKYAKNH